MKAILMKVFAIILLIIGSFAALVFGVFALALIGTDDFGVGLFSLLAVFSLVWIVCGIVLLRRSKKKNTQVVHMSEPAIEEPEESSEREEIEAEELVAVVCSACGAVNHIPMNGTAKCEYCDSLINN